LHVEENADPNEQVSYEWSLMDLRKAKYSELITGFVTRLTRRVPILEFALFDL